MQLRSLIEANLPRPSNSVNRASHSARYDRRRNYHTGYRTIAESSVYKTIAESSVTGTIVFGVSMIHVKTAHNDRRRNFHTRYKTIADH